MHTVPLAAHLTPETSEPWEGQMVDAGWGAGRHVCIFVYVSACDELYQGTVERKPEREKGMWYASYL